jgi:phosphohistidine phosphatase
MKTLLVMRHAKSSHEDPSLLDRERPLNSRGRQDAPAVGRRLERVELVPDRILASSAVRTQETAQGVAGGCGYRGRIVLLDSLYAAPPEAYVTELVTQPDDATCVLVVGHNPGLEELLVLLTGKREYMPTAALAYLKLPIDHWAELPARAIGELVEVWRPKESFGPQM